MIKHLAANRILLGLLLFFLVYQTVLIEYSHSEFPKAIITQNFFPYLSDKPMTEDGHYMLAVAWNIAKGRGFVYNYDIPTTGVQPLATIIYSALAKITQIFGGGKISFVKVVLYYSVIISLLIWLMSWKTARKLFVNANANYLLLMCFLLTALNLQTYIHVINGMETGIYLLLSIFLLYRLVDYHYETKDITKKTVFNGLLMGATLLARLDFAIVIAILIAGLILSKKIDFKKAIVLASFPLTVGIFWVLFSYFITGNFIQSSIDAQTRMF